MLWLQYTYYTQLSTSDTNSFALSSLYNIIYHIIRDARAVRSSPVGICVYTSNLYVIFPFIPYSWSVYTYSFSSNISLTSLSTSLYLSPPSFFLSLSIYYRTRWFCLSTDEATVTPGAQLPFQSRVGRNL